MRLRHHLGVMLAAVCLGMCLGTWLVTSEVRSLMEDVAICRQEQEDDMRDLSLYIRNLQIDGRLVKEQQRKSDAALGELQASYNRLYDKVEDLRLPGSQVLVEPGTPVLPPAPSAPPRDGEPGVVPEPAPPAKPADKPDITIDGVTLVYSQKHKSYVFKGTEQRAMFLSMKGEKGTEHVLLEATRWANGCRERYLPKENRWERMSQKDADKFPLELRNRINKQ